MLQSTLHINKPKLSRTRPSWQAIHPLTAVLGIVSQGASAIHPPALFTHLLLKKQSQHHSPTYCLRNKASTVHPLIVVVGIVGKERSQSLLYCAVSEKRSQSLLYWAVNDERSQSLLYWAVNEERSQSLLYWAVNEERSQLLLYWAVSEERSHSLLYWAQ